MTKKGIKVIPEVMIPLIGGVKELQNQKAIVLKVADEVLAKAGLKKLKYYVGTMIEIPAPRSPRTLSPRRRTSSASAPTI